MAQEKDRRDRDELNMRQNRRAELRKKKLAQQRRMKRRLILAAVLLLVCGLGIFFIARSSGSFGIHLEKEPQQETEAAVETTRPPAPTEETRAPRHNPITRIHIKAAGDLNVTTAVVDSGLSAGGYDYTQAFIDVAPVLSDADLTVLNFEGNVCGEPYGSETRSAPKELLTGLLNAGVDVVQTANSYSVWNGLIGLNTTLNNIRASGLVPVGAYTSPEEFDRSKGYIICDVQGIKVAMVAFTKGLGGRGMPAGNEECVNLLYEDYDESYKKVNTKAITRVLRSAAAEKPDITIAMLHWGSEFNDQISRTQTEIVELMQSEGVDVILGSHPHTVQWVDFDKDAGTLVAYSLGDFFGDATAAGTNYSIILDLEITKDATSGVTKVTDYTYTPIYTLAETDREEEAGISRQVVRIRTAMEARRGNYVDRITDGTNGAMEYSLQRIHDRISGKDQDPEQIAAAQKAKEEAAKKKAEEEAKAKKEKEKAEKKAEKTNR